MLYQGQTVSFEWQSRQARFQTPDRPGVIGWAASIRISGSVGGLLLSGRYIWIAARRTTSVMLSRLSALLMLSLFLQNAVKTHRRYLLHEVRYVGFHRAGQGAEIIPAFQHREHPARA